MELLGHISSASPQQALAVVGLASVLIWIIYLKLKAWKKVPSSQLEPKAVPLPLPLAIKPLLDFDWRSVKPQKFRPFKPVYHITMGLQASTPSDLITIDRDYLDRVMIRRSILEKYPETVHGFLPQGIASVREVYSFLLRDYLPTRYPTMFRLSDNGTAFQNMVTEKTYPTTPMDDPSAVLRAIGETVEEDMFLLHDTPDGHLCVAFVCCFPSGFDPSKKFGKHLKAIHAPVPAFEKIGASMERAFSRIEVGKSVKRLNWSVQTHGELLNCDGHITEADADISVDNDVDIAKTHLRVELQTLTRLPQTRAILFSFKTYMYPVEELKEEGLGPAFADAIEGLKSGNAPGMWVYKGTVRWGDRVCEYLRS